jgi:hypothetical protein
MESINTLLTKFNNFKDDQLHSIQKPSDSSLLITLAVQDDYGDDTHHIEIEFIDVKDAKLLEHAFLPYLDMMSGVSIIKEHDLYGFAVGNSDAMLHVKNSPFFIISSEIKIEEKAL